MTRGIRIAAATVMVAAGLIGAVAAPASAAAPRYHVTFTCESSLFPQTQFFDIVGVTRKALKTVISSNCVPHTVQDLTKVRL
jgi:hypothetical protein